MKIKPSGGGADLTKKTDHEFFKFLKKVAWPRCYGLVCAETIEAFRLLSEQEGIIPALESAHAVAHAAKIAPKMDKSEIMVICLSGRGDKDAQSVSQII